MSACPFLYRLRSRTVDAGACDACLHHATRGVGRRHRVGAPTPTPNEKLRADLMSSERSKTRYFFQLKPPWLNWLERWLSKLEVQGSIWLFGSRIFLSERNFTPISSSHPCVNGIPGERQWKTLWIVTCRRPSYSRMCILPRKSRWLWNV